MADLADQEKSFVWALLEKSETLRHTRGRFRTIVSDELDKIDIAPARRELIFEFARQRAEKVRRWSPTPSNWQVSKMHDGHSRIPLLV